MVKKEVWLYLFIGQDPFSKDAKLREIKSPLFSSAIESFNLDTLYAKDLTLKELQERLLSLPVKTKKRLLVIKDAQILKEPIREFLLDYSKNPAAHVILILDLDHYDPRDDFISRLAGSAQVYRFKEPLRIDAFTLARQIELGRPDYALRVLNQLLKKGEKPEMIVGGLRHSLLKGGRSPAQVRKVIKLLLDCDIAVKTSRLKPAFALERAVVELCCLRNLAR